MCVFHRILGISNPLKIRIKARRMSYPYLSKKKKRIKTKNELSYKTGKKKCTVKKGYVFVRV